MKELSARKNVHICAQHVCFKRARFQVSYKFIRVITCNLHGSPYRRNLGVIILNGRSSIYMSALYEELVKSDKKCEKVMHLSS